MKNAAGREGAAMLTLSCRASNGGLESWDACCYRRWGQQPRRAPACFIVLASSSKTSCSILQTTHVFPTASIKSSDSASHFHLLLAQLGGGDGPLNGTSAGGGSGNNNNNNNNNNSNNSSDGENPFDFEWWWDYSFTRFLLFSMVGLGCFWHLSSSALARTSLPEGFVWEVRGGKWTRLVADDSADAFFVDPFGFGADDADANVKDGRSSTAPSSAPLLSSAFFRHSLVWCRGFILQLMLPEGYPHSVSVDYLEYSLWRAVQGVASQISGVLTTQALLYAVGLGKGAIPMAAAVNWVLKDGLGYLSKILLSKFGRHFDVHPKGWRLFADLLENTAYGLELLTPMFPDLFLLIGAAAGAGRSAAALIQASTRSCFYAGFAAQRNFAEVIAKGEAQGMMSKFLGIMLGIALANCIGSSGPLVAASFTAVTAVHMFCNLKSYQSIQIRNLNPYRASLVFSEYLLSGQVPPVKEVNDEEPLFPGLPLVNVKSMRKAQLQVLSAEAKEAAAQIEARLQLGSKFSEVVNSKEDAIALFNLYRNEGYILAEHKGRFSVILKEGCSPHDMLKSLFHVSYLYWLEMNVGIKSGSSFVYDCKSGGKLQMSLDYVQREFKHVKHDGELAGWVTDGLIARPLPYRIRPVYA